MGKKEIDIGNTISEINDDSEVIAAAIAARRSVERRGIGSNKPANQEGEPAGRESSYADVQARANPKTVRTPERTKAPTPIKKKSKSGHRNRESKPGRADDDPFVTASIKIRNSKLRRLQKLSKRRDLDDLSPHYQKDLIDEALDWMFQKYEPPGR